MLFFLFTINLNSDFHIYNPYNPSFYTHLLITLNIFQRFDAVIFGKQSSSELSNVSVFLTDSDFGNDGESSYS